MDIATHSVRHLFPQVFANGFVPLPNFDKRCFLPKWPTILVDERQVAQWSRSKRWPAIGLRLEPSLIVVDIDVLDAEIAAAVERMMPSGTLRRIGQAPKAAHFLRYAGPRPFAQMLTRNWTPDITKAKPEWSKVEIFAGTEPGRGRRQFGAFGPHKREKGTDAVLSTYSWPDGRDPSNTPLTSLPEISFDQALVVIETAERLMQERDFQVDLHTRGGARDRVLSFDLGPATMFEGSDDVVYDLTTLEAAARAVKVKGGDLRVSGSFTRDPHSAGARRRCLVGISPRYGRVYVYDTKTGITHHPAALDEESLIADADLLKLIRGGIA